MDLSAFQASTSHYNKTNIDLDQYYLDKENCNVHQPRVAERQVLQPKNIHYNPLSEITDDTFTQSTKESSPDYDQTSILGGNIFQSFIPMNQNIQKNCLHLNIMQQRCAYCKDCGSFLPKTGSTVFREQSNFEKLTLCPDEVYAIMLKNQHINRTYFPEAPHLQIRKTITDWIFQVSQDLKISPDTTHSIIAYVDTILCRVEVTKENLQLVILTCLILATKFSEMDEKVPALREAYNLCQGLYSVDLFKKSEGYVLEQLDWNLRVITPYQFVHHYISKGCIFSSDQTAFPNVDADILRYLRRYAECFVNLSLDNYEFNQFSAHIVASAAIASTRKLLGISPFWNAELEELTGTSWDVIEPCFNELYSQFESSFPELVDLSKVLADKQQDIQNQKENQFIQINEDAMNVEQKDTPDRKPCTKTVSNDSGYKTEHPIKEKQLKRKNLSRFGKANNKENKSKNIKQQENNSMNIEASTDFFENTERTGSIKRNLIY